MKDWRIFVSRGRSAVGRYYQPAVWAANEPSERHRQRSTVGEPATRYSELRTPELDALPPPDLPPPPAPGADAHRPIDHHAALTHRVGALLDVARAEMALAERTLQARVRAALLRAAEPGRVPLSHTGAVLNVGNEIQLLDNAALTPADGFVFANNVRMRFAEMPSAVHAGLHWRIRTAGESPAQLTGGAGHIRTLVARSARDNAGRAGRLASPSLTLARV